MFVWWRYVRSTKNCWGKCASPADTLLFPLHGSYWWVGRNGMMGLVISQRAEESGAGFSRLLSAIHCVSSHRWQIAGSRWWGTTSLSRFCSYSICGSSPSSWWNVNVHPPVECTGQSMGSMGMVWAVAVLELLVPPLWLSYAASVQVR